MKLFDDMTPREKINHCEVGVLKAYQHLQAEHGPVELADIVDVWDYWAPYLIARARKLEAVAEAAKAWAEEHQITKSETIWSHEESKIIEALAALEAP